MQTGNLKVLLLGEFKVMLPDGEVAGPWIRPSARRVFQVLVLREQHRIGREELAELLFPELKPERAANAVSKALTMVRSALSPFDIVKSNRNVIWLEGQLEVDAEVQRRRLREALAAPPGDSRDASLVAGLEQRGRLLDDELYADWAADSRADLEGLRASARRALASDRTAGHGRAGTWDVVEAWQNVLRYDPSDEEACAASMRTSGTAGMTDLVVRTYHRTVAAVHDLGSEPSESLQHFYAQALEHARSARPQEAPRTSIRTFGREAALAQLRDLVGDRQRADQGGVLVSGPAGIGKSHLLDVIARELQAAGWLVAQSGAESEDRRVPLRSLRNVLAQLDLSSGGPLVRQLAAPALGQASDDEPPIERRALLDELLTLFDSLSLTRPFVVMIDDLQWADVALREILADLAGRRSGGRWTMVLAARSDEAGVSIVPPPTVATLALVPLSSDGVTALLCHTEPGLDEEAISWCASRSAGNPFFAIELARQRAAGTPEQSTDRAVPALIVQLLETRLARCSEGARRILSLVALLGEAPSVEVLLRLDARPGEVADSDRTIRTIDELVDAHLLDERPDGVRLVHPLLRDAAVARLDPPRRAALHTLLAEASAGEVAARHRLAAFEASGLPEHAGLAARAGFITGHQARRLFADDAALELFAGGLRAFAAATDLDREGLRAGALDAWCQFGDIHLQREAQPEAERAYRAAMDLAANDDERGRVWSALAGLAYRVGAFEDCVATYKRGISSLQGPSPLARALLETDLGWTYFRLGRPQDAVVVLERATATLGALGDGLRRGHAFDRLATVLGVVGRPEEGLAVIERAFEAVGPTGDERELMVLHTHRAMLYSQLGRFGEALADMAAALRMATASGDGYSLAMTHWITGHVHEVRGDLSAALAERDMELAVLKEIRNVQHTALAHAARSRLLRALDRPAESEEAAACARELGAAQGDEALSARIEQQLLVIGF